MLALLAISALTVASYALAQESNGSPNGLYALPDSGESEGKTTESTSNRSAQSYLNSLDPRSTAFQRNLEEVEAAHKAAATKRTKEAAAGGNAQWSPGRSLAEGAWIAILAGTGLLVVLASAAYLWWSRTQFSGADPCPF